MKTERRIDMTQTTTKTLEQQIQESDADFVKAFNSGNLDALETLHGDDAMLLAPDTPTSRGDSQAVVQGFRDLWDAGWRNITLDSVEIDADGDLAYHVGRVGFDVPTQQGSSKTVAGKFVDIYKRHADGAWKIRLTIYNMDEPVPPA